MRIECAVTFRPMGPEDIPDGLRLCRVSHWNQVEDDWRVFLDSPGSRCYVAEKRGEVVGTVAILEYQTCAWIAMMLVDPRERGAGIGSRLLEQTLSAVADVPSAALDATPAGEMLYRRYGFINEHSLIRMRATIGTHRFPLKTGPVRRIEEADLPRIFRRDRETFGADRSLLLTSLFRRASQYAWMAGDGTHLLGYCFGRPGHLYDQVGPIMAERETSAALWFPTASWNSTENRSRSTLRRVFQDGSPGSNP